MVRAILIGAVAGLIGCGDATLPTSVDSAAPDTAHAPTTITCTKIDGYVEFHETAIVIADGGTCTASYAISRGVNTFNCECLSDVACAAASLQLQSDGTTCFNSF